MTLVERIKGQAPVSPDRIEWLGAIGGRQYGTHRGQEYEFDLAVSEWKTYSRALDEIAVAVKRDEQSDDNGDPKWPVRRGWPVPAGTYAKLAAKHRKPAEKKLRGWNRLAELVFLQRRAPQRMASGTAALDLPLLDGQLSKDQEQAMASVVELAIKRAPSLIEVGGHEPPETIADALDRLRQRAIQVGLDKREDLWWTKATPLRFDERQFLEDPFFQRLAIGELSGKRVPCGLCEKPAGLYVMGTSHRCAEHAQ